MIGKKRHFFPIIASYTEDTMKYLSLVKLYYANPKQWAEIYQYRYNSFSSKHIDFEVKQYNRIDTHKLFYCYNEEIALLINKITTTSIKFFKCVSQMPGAAIKQFIESCLVDEIKSSNAIEGIHSSRKDIIKAFSIKETPKEYVRYWGIANKYRKIIYGETIPLETPIDIRKLYDNFIAFEICRDNSNNIPDGKFFRKDSVDIVTGTQKVLHQGVFPESKIIHSMEKALEILHDEKIPIFIRISIFHYMFGYIHPFYDGNGRMSRFITSYYIAKEIHPAIAFRLSLLIKIKKKSYYNLFEVTNNTYNRGDLTPFIIASLDLLLSSIESTTAILNEKLSRYEKLYDILSKKLIDKDITTKKLCCVLLQAAIFSNDGATTEEIAVTIGKTTKTVRSKIEQISENIIIKNDSSKPFRFKLDLKYLQQI